MRLRKALIDALVPHTPALLFSIGLLLSLVGLLTLLTALLGMALVLMGDGPDWNVVGRFAYACWWFYLAALHFTIIDVVRGDRR